MPGRFGNVAKAYLIQDEQENEKSGQIIKNPLAINCYILAYNSSKQLTNANIVTKENIRNYLSQFRLLTDAVNIKDGFIINLGVDFSIVPLPGYQGKEVLSSFGVTIQRGIVAQTPNEAVVAAKKLTQETGTGWHVIKAQVHAGGRGKGVE